MQNNNIGEFQSALSQSDYKLFQHVQKLIQPNSQKQLRQDCKLYLTYLSSCLRQGTKPEIQKIAKFIIMIIMSGHIHLLHYLDKYFIANIIDIGGGVLKFKALSPVRDKNKPIQAKKWRNQFVGQLLYLLSQWFPKDLINTEQDSKYVRIVRNKKFIIKGYFLLNSAFIENVQYVVSRAMVEDSSVCEYCKRCYEKQKSGLISCDKISKKSGDLYKQITLGPHQSLISTNSYQSVLSQQHLRSQLPYFNVGCKETAAFHQYFGDTFMYKLEQSPVNQASHIKYTKTNQTNSKIKTTPSHSRISSCYTGSNIGQPNTSHRRYESDYQQSQVSPERFQKGTKNMDPVTARMRRKMLLKKQSKSSISKYEKVKQTRNGCSQEKQYPDMELKVKSYCRYAEE